MRLLKEWQKSWVIKLALSSSLLFSLAAPVVSQNPELGNLEQRLFFKNYSDEDDNTRINRIEKQIFGETFPDSLAERLARIHEALPKDKGANSQISSPTPPAIEKVTPPNSYHAPKQDDS